ncbi:hypothetical protein CAC42_3784 [Sphaceloma murrayae]|uniref:CENP-C homolog n=1 Tax=Sphaceloma murrayae TaxID=2082308 RepID=A0A2K1QH66_9PEZI|nr:hypothetical protein CAC42_3784 [Sphaceloma murrayae]
MSVARTPGRVTPGRRRNANKENVYFEPGKQGRKTGITIPDRGVRDEHGFEPVSGLFSSPQKAPQSAATGRRTRNSKDTSGAMYGLGIDGLEGIAAQSSLQPQRTPRLPPPRSQTPRHTNIGGSPVRHSSVKPTRVMQDPDITPTRAQSEVIHSIERDPSPVQIRSAANAHVGRGRKSIFDFNLSPEKITPRQAPSSPPPGAIEEVSQILDTNDYDVADTQLPQLDDSLPNVSEQSLPAPSPRNVNAGEPNTKRKREQAQRSDVSTTITAADASHMSSDPRSSAKRRRIAMDTSQVEPSPSQNARSSNRATTTFNVDPVVPDEDEEAPVPGSDDPPHSLGNADDDDEPQRLDGQEVTHASLPSSPAKRGRSKRKSILHSSTRRRATSTAAPRASAPKPSRAQRESTARTTASAYSAHGSSPDDDEEEDNDEDDHHGTTRMGSIRLRSATPAAEQGAQITRSGRASIKPLAYWKNETYVWREGSIDGVIRAEEIPVVKKRRGGKRGPARRRKAQGDDDDHDEDDGALHEDLLPEAWEQDMKIIRGPVRAWDRELGAGGVDEVKAEIAFSNRGIDTQEVAGGSFRYAKVLSSDFFGAGVVEIPPGGIKRSKNSRKMQMAFFVHEGKVTVDVAGMGFGVTQGGMWHVPRGNNYAIENESTVFPAKIFFAQGCEWDADVAAAAKAAAEAEVGGAGDAGQ